MSTENEAAIKVIVELQAKPGKRAELKNLLESVATKYGPAWEYTSNAGSSSCYKIADERIHALIEDGAHR